MDPLSYFLACENNAVRAREIRRLSLQAGVMRIQSREIETLRDELQQETAENQLNIMTIAHMRQEDRDKEESILELREHVARLNQMIARMANTRRRLVFEDDSE